jgi:hypothetical protein
MQRLQASLVSQVLECVAAEHRLARGRPQMEPSNDVSVPHIRWERTRNQSAKYRDRSQQNCGRSVDIALGWGSISSTPYVEKSVAPQNSSTYCSAGQSASRWWLLSHAQRAHIFHAEAGSVRFPSAGVDDGLSPPTKAVRGIHDDQLNVLRGLCRKTFQGPPQSRRTVSRRDDNRQQFNVQGRQWHLPDGKISYGLRAMPLLMVL